METIEDWRSIMKIVCLWIVVSSCMMKWTVGIRRSKISLLAEIVVIHWLLLQAHVRGCLKRVRTVLLSLYGCRTRLIRLPLRLRLPTIELNHFQRALNRSIWRLWQWRRVIRKCRKRKATKKMASRIANNLFLLGSR